MPETTAEKKDRLEIEKLEAELETQRNSNRWSYSLLRNVKLNEWGTMLAAFGTMLAALFVAYSAWRTDFFNASKLNLETKQERLKIDYERQSTEFNAKKKDLDEIRSRVEPLEREDASLRTLRRCREEGLYASLEFDNTLTIMKVKFFALLLSDRDLPPPQVPVPGEQPQPPKPHIEPAKRPLPITDGIRAANGFRKLQALEFNWVSLNGEQLSLVTQRESLSSLSIAYSDLDANGLANLRPKDSLTELKLNNNKITSIANLPLLKSLKTLAIANNPIGDDGIKELQIKFPNLVHLDLSHTKVSEKGLSQLTKLPSLWTLNLSNTSVTGEGLLNLISCPQLVYVNLEKGKITPQLESILNQKGARFKLRDKDSFSWGI